MQATKQECEALIATEKDLVRVRGVETWERREEVTFCGDHKMSVRNERARARPLQ